MLRYRQLLATMKSCTVQNALQVEERLNDVSIWRACGASVLLLYVNTDKYTTCFPLVLENIYVKEYMSLLTQVVLTKGNLEEIDLNRNFYDRRASFSHHEGQ